MTKNGPKWPKNGQNLTLRALGVRNGWNGVERSWNELGDIYAGIFRPTGSAWFPPILAQGRPKRAKLAKNAKKCQFDGSGGPERLEQCGTELERGRGGPSRSFWTNFEEQIAPKFGPGAPEMAQIGPKCLKMAISRFWWSKTVGTAWTEVGTS